MADHEKRPRDNGIVALGIDDLTESQRKDPTEPGPAARTLLRTMVDAVVRDTLTLHVKTSPEKERALAQKAHEATVAMGTYLRALEDEVRMLRATTAGMAMTLVANNLPLPTLDTDEDKPDA